MNIAVIERKKRHFNLNPKDAQSKINKGKEQENNLITINTDPNMAIEELGTFERFSRTK